MSEQIDLEKLYREEHRRWMREEAPRRSFRDVLTGSVPYWIVVVALVLYGLSAPHTAGVFDKLTPGWGFIALVGVVQLVQRSLENRYPALVIQRAYNGQQACEMMRMAAPDLVLLDLVMPTMSGFEVIAAMKDDPQLQHIPIILLTATKYIYSDDETRGELRIQHDGGLKPMEVLKLLNMITQTVNS